MFITGIGTAAPSQPYKQKSECWAAVQVTPRFATPAPRSRAILRKILTGNNGIETRHLALESLHEVFDTEPDLLHARFVKNAPLLATEAAKKAHCVNAIQLPPAKLMRCSSALARVIFVRG